MTKWFYHEDERYGMIRYGQIEEIIPYHLSVKISYRILSQVQIPDPKGCHD